VQEIDTVVVFRPSLTSIAGVITLLQSGQHPLLIMDRPVSEGVRFHLRRIVRLFSERYPHFACITVRQADAGGANETASLPFALLLAAYVAESLGLPKVLVFDGFSVASGLVGSADSQHGITTVKSRANLLLAEVGAQCRIDTPFAHLLEPDIVKATLTPAYGRQELVKLLNDLMGCCCGMCPHCLQQCAILRCLGHLSEFDHDTPKSPAMDLPSEYRVGVVHLLTALNDACTLPDLEMLGRFPELASIPGLPALDALGLARHTAGSLRHALMAN
jgi:hypothetical protein